MFTPENQWEVFKMLIFILDPFTKDYNSACGRAQQIIVSKNPQGTLDA